MHKALHPRDNIDRLYVSRREGGRGHASIEDSIDTSIQRLTDYIEKHRGRLFTTNWNDTNDMRTSGMIITRKQKWEEKQFYGCFKWLTCEIHIKMGTWLKKRKPKERNWISSAQNNAIMTNQTYQSENR